MKKMRNFFEFVVEYADEFERFLNATLSHVMDRLKIRIAFAKNGEGQPNE
ncbi:hypothetical protein SS7213T_04010 [Staphylococcus simiae CCM 7213 = CCUG 51256]|uniref:Uncharacterized protein n=1 Tax=Staphylococcus simiae CCM 7213 = CCUG 51256 TaxID=911238 RepID=G5JH73_9STAP|nr:hypothetical protein SS7213T_04010 [Staphylococcus simiae CCM 7213 = CCUG 51256]